VTHLLEVRALVKSFGGVHALSGLDMHVDEGEIVSAIGPNGAGKSTLFNVATGLYPPDEGEVLFQGRASWACAPTRSRGSGWRGPSRPSTCSRT